MFYRGFNFSVICNKLKWGCPASEEYLDILGITLHREMLFSF